MNLHESDLHLRVIETMGTCVRDQFPRPESARWRRFAQAN